MDATPFRLHALFPKATFGPPSSEAQIAAAEALLGFRLPEQLRQMYLECDGMQEDRGGASYLHPLFPGPSSVSLLSSTQFFWRPRGSWPDMRSFVFFGSSGGDDKWGVNWKKPGEVIAFSHHMMDQYEVVGSDILVVLQNDYAEYERLP